MNPLDLLKRPRRAPGAADPEQIQADRRVAALALHQPDEAEQRDASMVGKKLKVAETAKQPLYGKWATSLAFFVGEHYMTWSADTRRLVAEEEIPSWRVRITDPQITQIALTVAAKLAKARHITTGDPNNPDNPRDVAAAQTATKLLRHLDRVTERQRKRRKLELLKVIYGTAFTIPFWSPKKSSRVAITDYASGQVETQEAVVGDQDFEVCTVWDIFPQPVSDWDDVQWCIKAKWRTLEWIEATFGEKGLLVSPEAPGDDLFYAGTQTEGVVPDVMGTGTSRSSSEPGARVMVYLEKPCTLYPEGRHIVVANSVVLFREDRLPHPRRRWELIPQFGVEVPGRLWGKGWVEDCVDQQRELNKTESQLIENKDLTSRPKYKVAREDQIEEDALDSEPGEVVLYTRGAGSTGPEPIQAPTIPQYVADLPEKIIERIQNIAGIHDVSRGQAPSGVKSGVAIDLLKETDDARLSMTTDAAADAWRLMDELMLESVQARYIVPRLIKVVGKDEPATAFAFVGADLAGNTSVRLDTSEGVTDSLAAARQRVMDYRASGFFDLPAPILIGLFRIMNETQLADLVDKVAREAAQQQAAMAQMEAQAAEEDEQQTLEMEQPAQTSDYGLTEADLYQPPTGEAEPAFAG